MSRIALPPGAWRLGYAIGFGWREYRAHNPFAVVAVTVLPRAVLSCLFFTLLGRVIGGQEQQSQVFVGTLALSLSTAGLVAVSDVAVADKWFGVFYRIRTGLLDPFIVHAARAVPHAVIGVVGTVLSLVIVAPLLDLGDLAIRLTPLLPIYLLMAASTTAAGLAGAALAVGKRVDVLVGNLLSYLVILAGGIFIRPGQAPWLDVLGAVLPIRHGLEAVHAALAGNDWLPQVGLELAVGAGWTLLAWAALTRQVRRAHRHGFDEFA